MGVTVVVVTHPPEELLLVVPEYDGLYGGGTTPSTGTAATIGIDPSTAVDESGTTKISPSSTSWSPLLSGSVLIVMGVVITHEILVFTLLVRFVGVWLLLSLVLLLWLLWLWLCFQCFGFDSCFVLSRSSASYKYLLD